MRLDKFLKMSRIVKRRTVANEASTLGRVTVNGVVSKPSRTIKPGDVIGVRFGNKEVLFKVLSIPEANSITKEQAESTYEVVGKNE